jgi:hypothetical protein
MQETLVLFVAFWISLFVSTMRTIGTESIVGAIIHKIYTVRFIVNLVSCCCMKIDIQSLFSPHGMILL